MNPRARFAYYGRREAWCRIGVVLMSALALAFAAGVFIGAIERNPVIGVSCGPFAVGAYFAARHLLLSAREWSRRAAVERHFFGTEQAPPVPDSLRRDLCGDPLAGDFH